MMDTPQLKSKWMRSRTMRTDADRKTLKLEIVTNTEFAGTLGEVRWATNFRKYAFFPAMYAQFDADCLIAIASFLTELMIYHSTTEPKTLD